MAETKNGILGAFKGKVGPVSGYTRHGRNIMRTSSSRVRDNATPRRQAQREKIRVCNGFINAFSGTGIFAKTFPNTDHGGSGYNRAMKVLMNSALEGVYPDYRIMYDKFLISKGELPAPKDAAAGLDTDGNLVFTWANNSTEGTAKANDIAVVIAYFPGQSVRLVYSLDAATRETGFAKLIIPAGNEASLAETWIGFVSADGLIASNSVYTGSLEV
jgi:uncharacterized protein DUF6266